jgi:hypothetical protein
MPDFNEIAESIERCFISPNVSDSNFEHANIVDVLQRIAYGSGEIASAISTRGSIPYTDGNGIRIGCLTEAVIGLSVSMNRVADAIFYLADNK